MSLVSKMFWKLLGHRDISVLMIGPQGSGKTTILNTLRLGPNASVETSPTTGSSPQMIQLHNTTFEIWEIGGQEDMQSVGFWNQYPNLRPNGKAGVHAIIFVLDASDRDQIPQAREELHLLRQYNLRDKPLLILANKQDCRPNATAEKELNSMIATGDRDLLDAMTEKGLHKQLDLDTIGAKVCYVLGTWGKTGLGVYDGLEWLAATVSRQ
ncbi:P-loop containing nucleoside triphosphate hydrolase protein [Mycena floridula]|nr:P-loop containing nucleoside triphosphate hydrolase protein [Mycena floridula]